RRNWPIVEKIENVVRQLRDDQSVPSGLEIALTGNAMVGRDTTRAQVDSGKQTEFWTVLLIVVLLIAIYRAPLVALVPLATVYVALQVAIKFISILAQHGLMGLFEGVQIFVTVLVYGAGVDYCLFLIARYREELDRGVPAREAMAGAVARVGPALV